MKKTYLTSILILVVAMLFLPLSAGSVTDKQSEDIPAMGDHLFLEAENEGVIKVYRSGSGKIEEMSVEDYLFSVVAAEMPALYEVEAIKAQAVAAYTYAVYKKERSDEDYDITDDSAVDQAFITIEEAKTRWGEDYSLYEEKLRSAIKSVLYEKITFEQKTILAAYHAISSGKTERAVDIWGGDYSYLSSVESEGDKLSPNYLTTVEYTTAEVCTKLFEGVSAGDEVTFSNLERSEAGSVLKATVMGQVFTGGQIRKALALRSSNFEVTKKDDLFTFTVKGYGHGIGMSQYGAHYMAMQGKNYKEILLHYYPNCEIK